MCGLCGDILFSDHSPSPLVIHQMLKLLEPRGPESGGWSIRDHVAFGHRRLSIIDLSSQGGQPMHDELLRLSLVFNGCIYNYQELRKELIQQGYIFTSTSDTEVILKAWHAWGAACVERFMGMFAFAIMEWESGRVILARDRLGIKPLYLCETPQGVRFASTLPALLAAKGVDTTLDPVALNYYLSFHGVVPAPYTLLAGVRKLPPATLLYIWPDGGRKEVNYWQFKVATEEKNAHLSSEEWQERLLVALRLSVDRRMVADVPVGVLLSGGLDSSLIVALLAEAGVQGLHTFSIGFEAAGGEVGNEFIYSDLIAQHFATQHHQISISSHELLEALPAVIHAMSEPMVSHDAVGFYLLSREVARHLKVVQSGQGADEVFAGYHWYPPLQGENKNVDDYARVFFDRDWAAYGQTVTEAWIEEDYARRFVTNHFAQPGAASTLDKALRLDTTIMLVDDPVKRVDNMTMAWGLEARVPFLDHQLVELAGTIPPSLKLADGGKGILKAVARNIIPLTVIDRPKGYFPVPALKYIQGPFLKLVQEALESPTAKNRKLFRPEMITQLLNHPQGSLTPLGGSNVWQLGLLELWLQSHGI
ncbi:MAG: N-acetylglutaminylglutamine amidotransferase [Magnetococcus sp. DMHC-6]